MVVIGTRPFVPNLVEGRVSTSLDTSGDGDVHHG
jgi:hypothetical protein